MPKKRRFKKFYLKRNKTYDFKELFNLDFELEIEISKDFIRFEFEQLSVFGDTCDVISMPCFKKPTQKWIWKEIKKWIQTREIEKKEAFINRILDAAKTKEGE